MKKTLLMATPVALSLAALAGCNATAPSADITLYNGNSRFVVQSFDDQGSIAFPTYHSKNTGDVPYSELGNFFYVSGAANARLTKTQKEEGLYKVYTDDGKLLLTVDPKEDTMVVSNYEYWNGFYQVNNGIGPDFGAPHDEEICAVHTSAKTNTIGEAKEESYSLKKYGFDLIESEDKCYLPTQLLANLFYRCLANDLLYNGMDFYLSSVVQSNALMCVNQSYFATKGRFAALEDTDAIAYDPIGDESYRFAYKVEENDAVIYRIYSFTKDGKGKLLVAPSPTERGEEAKINDITYSYEWEKKDDGIYVKNFVTGKELETGQTKTEPRGTSKIPLKDTYYGTKTRSKEMAAFSYNLLRFQFDNFYGLKEKLKYDDFDAYATSKGLKEGLNSLDSATYDEALAKLTCSDIDDGHTRYTLPSIYTGVGTSGGEKLAGKYEGERHKNLIGKHAEYVGLRNQAMGLSKDAAPNSGIGFFKQGSTAVIRFDDFLVPGSLLSNSVTKEDVEEGDPTGYFKIGNIPNGFDSSFYQIKADKNIKNVVIDLTCNGGGQVMAIPYIVAHFTDDPHFFVKDLIKNQVKDFHYSVDLNHDQTYGGAGDTYKGQYNFFLLTSGFSFSCANFLPTIATYSGVKLIGEKTGGGTCSVAGFSDGSGSFYNVSSSNQIVLPKDDGFVHTDSGVEVDYPLESSSWYDLQKLDAFVSNLKN